MPGLPKSGLITVPKHTHGCAFARTPGGSRVSLRVRLIENHGGITPDTVRAVFDFYDNHKKARVPHLA